MNLLLLILWQTFNSVAPILDKLWNIFYLGLHLIIPFGILIFLGSLSLRFLIPNNLDDPETNATESSISCRYCNSNLGATAMKCYSCGASQ